MIDQFKETAKFYDRIFLDRLVSASELWLGKVIGYRKKRITKYLHIPVPFIERHYDEDYEFGTGEFEGLLLSVRWIKTPIPIGRKTIEVAIRKKRKGQTVRLRRYSSLN